ncbi:MAG: hypothetical protein GX235_11825 [Clostridiales bacterium]|nr:hypothetical protein [Clostridiales bacterium]
MSRMPVLFVGHGSPMNAMQEAVRSWHFIFWITMPPFYTCSEQPKKRMR